MYQWWIDELSLNVLFLNLDFWGWMVVAFFFIFVELISFNTYTLWLGVAAALVAILKLFVFIAVGWDWIIFAFLSFICLFLSRKFFSGKESESSVTIHDQRGIEYVGHIIVLTNPIENNRGRHLLDGVWWRIEGPNASIGTKVRIVGLEGSTLQVEIEE